MTGGGGGLDGAVGGGGSGGTVTGGGGGSGGSGGSSAGSCKGVCGSSDEQPGGCYCDSACEGNGDCCTDYATECPPAPQVTLPAGCVTNKNFKTYCNPVTNEGCTAPASCDYSSDGVKCYPDGNTEPAGAPCDTGKNKYCIPTYHCDGASQSNPVGTCKKFCCADSDCGGGKCIAANAQIGTLGICDGGGTTDGGSDGGGGPDAATDAATD